MRVTTEERVAEQRRDAGRRGDFNAALDRAQARRSEAGRADAGRAAQRAGERLVEARGARARGQKAGAVGATSPPGAGMTGAVRGAESSEPATSRGPTPSVDDAGAAPAAGPFGPGAAGPAGETGQAALAQAVRALPPVVETFHSSGLAALSLDFGGAVGVELRQAPGGVELRLSASAALLPAARAELAGLCRTLVARGVSVVSAEVRGGRPWRGRP
jgi:hypothetical protein